MRRIVTEGWHTTRYPISNNLVTVVKGYDIERSETPNDPQLITDAMYQSIKQIYFMK